jgi:hypothetical protein
MPAHQRLTYGAAYLNGINEVVPGAPGGGSYFPADPGVPPIFAQYVGPLSQPLTAGLAAGLPLPNEIHEYLRSTQDAVMAWLVGVLAFPTLSATLLVCALVGTLRDRRTRVGVQSAPYSGFALGMGNVLPGRLDHMQLIFAGLPANQLPWRGAQGGIAASFFNQDFRFLDSLPILLIGVMCGDGSIHGGTSFYAGYEHTAGGLWANPSTEAFTLWLMCGLLFGQLGTGVTRFSPLLKRYARMVQLRLHSRDSIAGTMLRGKCATANTVRFLAELCGIPIRVTGAGKCVGAVFSHFLLNNATAQQMGDWVDGFAWADGSARFQTLLRQLIERQAIQFAGAGNPPLIPGFPPHTRIVRVTQNALQRPNLVLFGRLCRRLGLHTSSVHQINPGGPFMGPGGAQCIRTATYCVLVQDVAAAVRHGFWMGHVSESL